MSEFLKSCGGFLQTYHQEVTALSSFGLFLIALFALKQIREARKMRINQAERDSREYAEKIVCYCLDNIIPRLSAVVKLEKELGIKQKNSSGDFSSLTNPKKISSGEISTSEIEGMQKVVDLKNPLAAKYYSEVRELLNHLEMLCLMINTRLADGDIVFDCIGGAVLNIIHTFNGHIRLARKARRNYIETYKNVSCTYEKWYKKVEVINKESERNNHIEEAKKLDKSINTLIQTNTDDKPLGTN
ncbi:MAG: hypothetical protein KBC62_02555 [Candidatus Pacebacteria bacterium]|nr:hypothetical protein [Candidatus Paceibacterota bacterium]MBP9842864.1 hypothetical protein [Candidatus Paceibacterota bacterium]